jgi:hypothetical protein
VSTNRHIQTARLKAAERKGILAELNRLAVDIGRCERTITSVMSELNSVNEEYKGPRTTREDVAYLTILLDCAKRKLAWEKQIASMQKRAPILLEGMARVLNDPDFPPTADEKAGMLRSLQVVQGALARLQPPETDDSPGTA